MLMRIFPFVLTGEIKVLRLKFNRRKQLPDSAEPQKNIVPLGHLVYPEFPDQRETGVTLDYQDRGASMARRDRWDRAVLKGSGDYQAQVA